MNHPIEHDTLYFEESEQHDNDQQTSVITDDASLPQQDPDIEIMCHIRDLLENSFPEENKGDPSFRIAYKQVVEYIARNCHHKFIRDWVDTDLDRGGKTVEYCELCWTLKK